MTDVQELLERYNPLLVTLPERPLALNRPGRRGPCRPSRGDYHPISAELFLQHATLQTEDDRAGGFGRLLGAPFSWSPPEGPTGAAEIRASVESTPSPEQSRGWFLDLTAVRSQSSGQAWSAYAELLQRTEAAARREARVVYGRATEARGTRYLQYWYLYAYNDAFNNHEGDWEQATIELRDDGTPERVGFSAHHGGGWRPWSEVKKDADSKRPLLFVSRGSHAGHFAYKERGWRPRNVRIHTGLPLLDVPVTAAARFLALARLTVDRPPAIEPSDVDWSPCDAGVLVDPGVRRIPDAPAPWEEDGFWWMRFQGKWGSTHPRVNGTHGPGSPWAPDAGDVRWSHPGAWLESVPRDPKTSSRSPLVDLSHAQWG
ncbi:MAG TPA: hypothetical protein QGF05_12880 [Dehalococcoidia bacterium]|nr:hypothetical protein [Dehalococcoidia bacterium]